MNIEPTLVTIDRLNALANSWKEDLANIRTLPVEEAAQKYVEFREIYDYLDVMRDAFVDIKEKLSKEVLPAVFEDSMVDSSVSLKSGFRITITHKTYATVLDKTNAYEWLENNELGDIIQPSVSASTLSAVAKKLLEENRSLPPELFKVTLQPNTSMTKLKK